MSTESVLDHHLDRIAAGDVDGIMADYTEDSVLLTPNGAVRGLAALRQVFSGAGGLTVDLKQRLIEGEVAYIVWSAGETIPTGTDTFIVRDDKIVLQTFAVHAQR